MIFPKDEQVSNEGEIQGRVIRKGQGLYQVAADGITGTVTCSISSTLRKVLVYPHADPSSRRPTVDKVEEIRTVDPAAINDSVLFRDNRDGSGMIMEVMPRKNKLSRMAAGPKPVEQVIVANVDQVIPVFAAAKPKPKWNLLDRYIVDAEASEIPVMICISKMDLAGEDIRDTAGIYERIGYPVVFTSAQSGEGLQDFGDHLKNKVSVFVGKSGVGKTTLLNVLDPSLDLSVKEVSKSTGKGKHTTSHLEMYELAGGGFVVDTPGMREFGIWEHEDIDIAYLFREMRPYLGRCRFAADCTHSHEPDCAVRDAVEAGEISEIRYQSYLSLME